MFKRNRLTSFSCWGRGGLPSASRSFLAILAIMVKELVPSYSSELEKQSRRRLKHIYIYCQYCVNNLTYGI